MTRNNEGSGLMSSALLAGSLFAIVTAPLAVFSSQPLSLELQGKTLFSGKLEDVASFYIGVAAVASVGVGALASGSSRKGAGGAPVAAPDSSASPEQSLFDVPVQSSSALSADEALSPLNLKASGLDFFLEEGVDGSSNTPELGTIVVPQKPETLVGPPMLERPNAMADSQQVLNPSAETTLRRSSIEPDLIEQHCDQKEPEKLLVLEGWTQAFLSDRPLVSLEGASAPEPAPSLYQPPALPTSVQATNVVSANDMPVPSLAQNVVPVTLSPAISVVTSVSDSQSHKRSVSPVMPAAQTYLSFTHSSSTEALYAPEQNRNLQVELEALEKLEQVREQIQVLSAQMEMLQSSLSLHGYSAKHLVALPSAEPQPSYTVSEVEAGAQSAEFQPSPQLAYITSAQRAIAS